MNVWNTRYTAPGWIFFGSFILLSLHTPFLQEQISSGFGVGLTLASLLAGVPVGYIIHSFFAYYFHLRGGTARYFDMASLRRGLNDIFRTGQAAEGDAAFTYPGEVWQQILSSPPTRNGSPNMQGGALMEERAFYTLIWQTYAQDHVRSSSERRWETYHLIGGSITAIGLAAVVSILLVGNPLLFLALNYQFLPVLLVIALVLFVYGEQLGRQAGNQESLWIRLFLDEVRRRPEILSWLTTSPHGR